MTGGDVPQLAEELRAALGAPGWPVVAGVDLAVVDSAVERFLRAWERGGGDVGRDG